MSEVSYHGWTHRPKADGGTDPIPVAPSSSIVEWAYYTSTTDWASGGMTTLSFSLIGGNYDNVTPTFDISSGNAQICRSGCYQAQIGVLDVPVAAGVQTQVRVRLERTAGPTPLSWRSATSWFAEQIWGEWSTNNNQVWPTSVDFFDYPSSLFSGTPSTLRLQAWRLDDGLVVDEPDAEVRLLLQRLGDSFS